MMTIKIRRSIFLLCCFLAIKFCQCTGLDSVPWTQKKQLIGPERYFTHMASAGPEVLWTANVGIGFGGPVIKDGKVYLLDRDDKVGDKLRCFDLSSGKELWSFGYAGSRICNVSRIT